MVDAVNIVGSGTPVAPVGKQQTDTASSTANAAKTLNAGSTPTAASTISSRLYVDSAAGGILVSAQVAQDGTIAQQTPSASVLAYLQNGLTIDGLPQSTTTV